VAYNHVHKILPPVPVLSQVNPITTFHPFSVIIRAARLFKLLNQNFYSSGFITTTTAAAAAAAAAAVADDDDTVVLVVTTHFSLRCGELYFPKRFCCHA
jgi:hypothetical protein